MLGGGGIFGSGKNEQPKLEETIAATSTMDTWDNHAASSYAGGTGSSSNPYKIQTAGQLALLAKQSKTNSFSGVYFSLEQPVDLSEYLWTGIGDDYPSAYEFAGNFNGNYNAITGVKIYKNKGFFVRVNNTTISKIILKDILLRSSDSGVGGLCGEARNSTISNCIIDNLNFFGYDNDYSCGVIGYAESSTIKDCLIINSTLESIMYIILQNDRNDNSIKNCGAINVVVNDPSIYLCDDDGIITSSFGDYYVFGTNTKTHSKDLYGSSGEFGDWMYNPNLNRGYPVQKSFLTISGSSTQTSAQVYNYLVSKGFSAA